VSNRLVTFIITILLTIQSAYAVECSVLFPGGNPIASFGSIDTIDIKGSARCNGSSDCSVENVAEERSPTIPAGGSNLGSFDFRYFFLSDTAYNKFTSWGNNTFFTLFGFTPATSVIYVERNGSDINIPDISYLNPFFSASEMMVIIKTNKKVEIGKDSFINAFLYIVADEVKINENVRINGALTVITDKLIVEEGVEINYDPSELDDLDSHGFCDNEPPTAVVDHYEIEHDGTGSTCEMEEVTIRACANADCSSLVTTPVTLDFLVGSDKKNTPTFTGEVTFSYPHLVVENAEFTLTNESEVAANPLECTGDDCHIQYSDMGCGDSCFAWFPDSIQGHLSSSEITFDGTGRVEGDSDEFVIFPTQDDSTATGHNTCGTAKCKETGTKVDSFVLPSFENSSGSVEIKKSNGTYTIGPGEDYEDTEYKEIKAEGSSTIIFKGIYDTFKVKEASIKGNSNVHFSAGVYWFEELKVEGGAKIIIDSAPVTIYVKDDLVVSGNAKINQFGQSQDIGIIGYKEIKLENSVEVKAAIYSHSGDTKLSGNARLTGTATVASNLKIENSSKIIYEGVSDLIIDGLCGEIPTPNPLHHFEIQHDGEGITCQAEDISILACADPDCTTLNADPWDVDLRINGTFDKSVTVVGGSVDTSFSYTTVGNATLSLDQPYECKNGASTSCIVNFADTGFIFYADGNKSNPFPNQISGKPSNTGYNSAKLNIQAVKTDDTTMACEAVLIDSETIEMTASCEDPSTCAGSVVTIDSTNIGTVNSGSTSYTPVTLDFGGAGSSEAEFVFNYPDAGLMKLRARYEILDEDGNPTGSYIQGSENIIVRPFGFNVETFWFDGADEIHSSDLVLPYADMDKWIAAGTDFTTRLTAVAWQAGDDTNNDGTPDAGSDLSDNSIPANFGNESTKRKASLEHDLLAPVPGNSGVISESESPIFTSPSLSFPLNYSEVGVIELSATLLSYLGGEDINGLHNHVGRFIPEHFELSILSEGKFSALCTADTAAIIDMPFAYSGQMDIETPTHGMLQYAVTADSPGAINPSFLITAKSTLGNTTQNYTGDFMRLLWSGVARVEPISDAIQLGKDGINLVSLEATLEDVDLTEVAGEITYTFNSDDHYVYTHELNSEIAPFTADINLIINAVEDEDGVLALDADGDPDNSSVLTLNPIGKEIRFGRALLENSFGPETSNLPQTLFVQYLISPDKYVPTTDDNCSQYNVANVTVSTSTLDHTLTPPIASPTSGPFEVGQGVTRNIELTAPGAGNTGKVNVLYDIYPWLEYYWDGSASAFTDPTAVATFGIYRGNDRIIYQREIID